MHNNYQDKPNDGKISANQNKAGVDETKGPGSADSSAAVNDGGSHVGLKRPGAANGEQKVEECTWWVRHVEIRPRRVVEMDNLFRF